MRTFGKATGFSASFLSQVELGQVSPSLGSLDEMATALGLTIADLLMPSRRAAEPTVRRRGEEALRSDWSHATVQSLLPPEVNPGISVLAISFRRSGRSGGRPRTVGRVELGICMRGRVSAVLDDAVYTLGPGDSIVLDARRPALWRNDGSGVSDLLLIAVVPRSPRLPTRNGGRPPR